jgi:hypothetical protein
LANPQTKNHTSAEMRRDASFRGAKCWFNLGKYDKAILVYEKLSDGDAPVAVQLEALGGVVSCSAALGQIEKVRTALLRIRRLLPNLDPEKRKQWEPWLDNCGKAVAGLLDREGCR